jgi:hypothetical protein
VAVMHVIPTRSQFAVMSSGWISSSTTTT